MVTKPPVHEYRFTCPLPNGIHARPASCLEQVVARFESRVSLENISNHRVANAHSVLSLVGADIKGGDKCILKVDGKDSAGAYQEIVRFLQNEFPACDNALPEISSRSNETYIPPVLTAAGIRVLPANPVVSGFGRGYVVFVDTSGLPDSLTETEITDVDLELRKIENAVARQRNDIAGKLNSDRHSTMERGILMAHLSIVNDVELLQEIHNAVKTQHLCAGKAILKSLEHFSQILQSSQSQLIRERVIDLKDICSQLIKTIYGSGMRDQITLTRPSVCIADNLTPSQFISIDKALLAGLVLVHGGQTSHTVILARSYGIPTLTGLKESAIGLKASQEVIVDANHGFLVADINDQVERFYAFERGKNDFLKQQITAFRDKPARTRDGVTIEVMANVAMADEAAVAIRNGAEGIGLFRTEMLFLGRNCAPEEQELFEDYKKTAVQAEGKPVVIRTFDIGGDKAAPYLNLPAEENPFLGYRGVRIYKQYENLFKRQVRAILRASAFGTVKLMIPMISCLEEILYVREILKCARMELESESIRFAETLPLGIMVEVPSIVFLIPQLANLVDFLSIGTNDLTQYFFAADRGNKQVNSLCQTQQPALLALIKKIVDDAHACHLRVGICGEMAGQAELLPLLLGTGIDELSVSIPHVMKIKAKCSEFNSQECRKTLEDAMRAETMEQVNCVLQNQSARGLQKPVVDISLVELDADCINKEEVIKYISDMLYMHQRTPCPLELEKDFWLREKVYSTGLGYGFAIPHCKTVQVNSNSICVLRLRQPILWGSVDNVPVDIIVGITIRETELAANSHMKIFSKLARSLMHKDFREQLRNIRDRKEIVAYLYEKLKLEK